jgi:hypothetical protein
MGPALGGWLTYGYQLALDLIHQPAACCARWASLFSSASLVKSSSKGMEASTINIELEIIDIGDHRLPRKR